MCCESGGPPHLPHHLMLNDFPLTPPVSPGGIPPLPRRTYYCAEAQSMKRGCGDTWAEPLFSHVSGWSWELFRFWSLRGSHVTAREVK
jgi:hypothetical protein